MGLYYSPIFKWDLSIKKIMQCLWFFSPFLPINMYTTQQWNVVDDWKYHRSVLYLTKNYSHQQQRFIATTLTPNKRTRHSPKSKIDQYWNKNLKKNKKPTATFKVLISLVGS